MPPTPAAAAASSLLPRPPARYTGLPGTNRRRVMAQPASAASSAHASLPQPEVSLVGG
jgi:hypothetical protein